MNNELQIVTGEDLLASIDDGTNRLFINSTEIDSSNWVGSGTYTTTISGHNISIVKIDSLDGNIGLKRLSEYNYELFRYETGSITADDVIGLKSFIEADDINVADNYATFTEASSRSNIDSGDDLKTIFGKIKKFFSDLKTVAFSGSYSDLSGTPDLSTKVDKSGDTMTGRLTIESNTDPLTLQRNTTNGTYILFKNNNGNLGYFGVLPNDKPIFSTSSGSDKEIALLDDLVVTTPTNITFTPNAPANVSVNDLTCKRLYGFTLVLLRLQATGTISANTEINLGTFNNLKNVGYITGVITAQNNTALLGTFIQVNNNLYANFLNNISLNRILVFTFTTIS